MLNLLETKTARPTESAETSFGETLKSEHRLQSSRRYIPPEVFLVAVMVIYYTIDKPYSSQDEIKFDAIMLFYIILHNYIFYDIIFWSNQD